MDRESTPAQPGLRPGAVGAVPPAETLVGPEHGGPVVRGQLLKHGGRGVVVHEQVIDGSVDRGGVCGVHWKLTSVPGLTCRKDPAGASTAVSYGAGEL